jgi:serine/threonine-protein kinase HipA
MDALDDPPGSYDLIWSEGAIYLIGFERGLRLWKPLLGPGGYACVTEASWLTDQPPEGAREFWDQGYPDMGTMAENIERAQSAGFESLGAFALPRSDWEVGLYEPLRARIEELRGEAELASIIEETEQEIRLFEEYGDSYGYVFYILRSNDR